MNILFANEFCAPYALGGAEWSMMELADALGRADHNVVLATMNWGQHPPVDQWLEGEMAVNAWPTLPPWPPRLRHLISPAFHLRFAKAIKWSAGCTFFYEERDWSEIDVIHAHSKRAIPAAWLAGKRLGIPVIATLRETNMICPHGQCFIEHGGEYQLGCGTWSRWWRECRPPHAHHYLGDGLKTKLQQFAAFADSRVLRWFLRRCDGVVAISEAILDAYEQAGLLPESMPRCVIRNLPPRPPTFVISFARGRLETPTDRKVVLYVGRLSRGKGVPDLLAAARVVTQDVESEFWFAGEGDVVIDGPHMKRLGQVPHEEIFDYYAAADLVVVPSRNLAASSRVVLEAMVMRKPVVATNVGELPELVTHRKTGLLVSPGDRIGLARAITALLLADDQRQLMGNGAQNQAAKWRKGPTAERMVAFYEQIRNREEP